MHSPCPGSAIVARKDPCRRQRANPIPLQAGSHAPLASIAEELEAVRARNDAQRARAQRMAAERMALEARTAAAEGRAAELEAAAEARLCGMPPGQRAAYLVRADNLKGSSP
jgi:hypothetical protein